MRVEKKISAFDLSLSPSLSPNFSPLRYVSERGRVYIFLVNRPPPRSDGILLGRFLSRVIPWVLLRRRRRTRCTQARKKPASQPACQPASQPASHIHVYFYEIIVSNDNTPG